jgi:methionine synthase I (cobalamin-dependent)/5,10-methylenetetrahydrofolate reductase
MRDFLATLSDRVVLFDGAMGTRLYELGVFLNRCFDELNVSNPALVESVHRSYITAGADVIETNTFGANRLKLDKHGLGDQVAAINREGAQLARKVADSAFVAGAIGPLGIRIEPWGPTSVEDAVGIFSEQAAALAEGGVDLFSIETFYDLAEIEAAVKGIRAVSDLPIVAHMTLEDDGNSLEGVAPEVFGARLAALPVNAVGVNCSVGPAAMLEAVERMARVVALPISAQPNAGKPRSVDNRNLYLCSPEYMAVYAKRFIEAGVRIVGGCCGTTPDHIKAIRGAVRAASPVRRTAVATITPAPEAAPMTPVPLELRSRLSSAIASGKFVVSVEMLPPRGHDLAKTIAGATLLHEAGIDAVNIPDGPRASARMSPMAMAVRLEREVGIETVIHYCCRDRNLLGMQSDLLGAHSLGLRNVLIVTGDPPKLGDYPDATAVFDVDSIGLTNMVSRLNRGLDVGGNAIGDPTGFYVGCGVNPGSPDLEREIARFEWKVDAGAQFCITQPVFDVETLLRFLERTQHVRIPVIAGVWPLASYRNAEFMNNEVPGVNVPESILERMRRADTKERARVEGIAIAREALTALLSYVQGAQISAPFGRYQTALEVAQAIPPERRSPSSTTRQRRPAAAQEEVP